MNFPNVQALCKEKKNTVLTVGRVHSGHTHNNTKLPHHAVCKREQSPVLIVGRVHSGHTITASQRAKPCPHSWKSPLWTYNNAKLESNALSSQMEESTLDRHTIMPNFPTASARQKRAKPCLHNQKSLIWTYTHTITPNQMKILSCCQRILPFYSYSTVCIKTKIHKKPGGNTQHTLE